MKNNEITLTTHLSSCLTERNDVFCETFHVFIVGEKKTLCGFSNHFMISYAEDELGTLKDARSLCLRCNDILDKLKKKYNLPIIANMESGKN